jgi:serine/threonine protein kinase
VDLSFVTDKSAIAYIKEFGEKSRTVHTASGIKQVLSKRLPYASEDALDLLQRMLSFNPYLRPHVEDCLEHPFFSKLRRPVFEVNAPHAINLEEIDSDLKQNAPPLNMATLKRIIIEEVKFFRNKR